jgi:hypothetical protein
MAVETLILKVRPGGSILEGAGSPVRQARFGRLRILTDAMATLKRHRLQRLSNTAGDNWQQSQEMLGRLLAKQFANRAVGDRLRERISAAAEEGRTVQIGIQPASPGLSDLPWETMWLPGTPAPIGLLPGVHVFRIAARAPRPAHPGLAGPLRILAVVASPDDGGPPLDHEVETNRIVASVEPARVAGDAEVQILHWGSIQQIRQALKAAQFHVLHISSHARAGVVQLEDDTGSAVSVTARALAEAISEDDVVPLVVMAGCSTARTADKISLDRDSEPETVSVADALIEAGVPAVLAMTTSVTDLYSIEFCASFYAALASAEHTNLLSAFCAARRKVEAHRQTLPPLDQLSSLIEWPAPVLFVTEPDQLLVTSGGATPRGSIVPASTTTMIGRHAELRRLVRHLATKTDPIGVVGVGGIGKTMLIEKALSMLPKPPQRLVRISGPATANEVRTVLGDLRPADGDGIVLWIDAFDTPRTDAGSTEDLPVYLRDLIEAAPLLRIVISGRRGGAAPIDLTDLQFLGPLAAAECRKLESGLPAVAELSDEDSRTVRRSIGGHPRGLTMLDERLRSGTDLALSINEVSAHLRAETGIENLVREVSDDHALRDIVARASVFRRPFEPEAIAWLMLSDEAVIQLGHDCPLDLHDWDGMPNLAPINEQAPDTRLRGLMYSLTLCSVGLAAPTAPSMRTFAVHPWIAPGAGLPGYDVNVLHRRAAIY